ncbi:MAG: HU family DNA-binding protein [Nitrospirae bacterium]|nr:HU family DNA-binding protein [Nitrospirota bacterium]MBF0541357.1 HU family DNA-binding protein [Nitrospirota bacterium]
MNKTDLISQIAKSVDLSKADAGRALDAMIDAIIKAVNDGQKVTLIGFGTFMITERKAREGRNPRTGETIKIPAARVPKFIPGKAFKSSIK